MIYVGGAIITLVLVAVLGFWSILKVVDNFGKTGDDW
jgi:hypothetical protein